MPTSDQELASPSTSLQGPPEVPTDPPPAPGPERWARPGAGHPDGGDLWRWLLARWFAIAGAQKWRKNENAIAEAVPPRLKTPADRAELRERYADAIAAGIGMRQDEEVAATMGLSRARVQQIRETLGIPRAEHATTTTLAARLGTSTAQIARWKCYGNAPYWALVLLAEELGYELVLRPEGWVLRDLGGEARATVDVAPPPKRKRKRRRIVRRPNLASANG